MLKEAIDAVAELAVANARVEIVRADSEPAHVYYLKHGDDLTRMEADPAPRNHKIHDLASLARICKEFADDEDQRVALWYSRGGMRAFLDDEQREHGGAVGLTLVPSRQMNLLLDWEKTVNWYKQDKLIQLLRIYFGNMLSANLIEAFRRLKFRVAQSGEKVVEHGRTSIGKQLDAEITGTGTLPDEVTVHVPAFAGNNLAIWVSVRCLVEIDAQAEQLAIVPEAGAVERAWLGVEDDLGRKLDELFQGSGVLVYRGVP